MSRSSEMAARLFNRCSMTIIEIPCFTLSLSKVWSTSLVQEGSRFAVGSSRMRRDGGVIASTEAMATRCFHLRKGYELSYLLSPELPLLARHFGPVPVSLSAVGKGFPAQRLPHLLLSGYKAGLPDLAVLGPQFRTGRQPGSPWYPFPVFEQYLSSFPGKHGGGKPARHKAKVDFPQPLGPVMVKNWPGYTLRFTPFSAGKAAPL